MHGRDCDGLLLLLLLLERGDLGHLRIVRVHGERIRGA